MTNLISNYSLNCQSIVFVFIKPGTVITFFLVQCAVIYYQDKCDHYWPNDREPRRYGDIQVQVVEEELDSSGSEAEYSITYMTMSNVRMIIEAIYTYYCDIALYIASMHWPVDIENPFRVILLTP